MRHVTNRISHMRGRHLLFVAAAWLPLAACNSFTPDHCFVMIARITPAAPVVTVGQSLQLTVTYNDVGRDCLPDVPASALLWKSAAPAVATIDSVQGLLRGLQAGQTEVTVHVPGSTSSVAVTEVKVRQP